MHDLGLSSRGPAPLETYSIAETLHVALFQRFTVHQAFDPPIQNRNRSRFLQGRWPGTVLGQLYVLHLSIHHGIEIERFSSLVVVILELDRAMVDVGCEC